MLTTSILARHFIISQEMLQHGFQRDFYLRLQLNLGRSNILNAKMF